MNTDPTLSMVLAGVRTLAAMFGGFAIAKGWINSDQLTQISGAFVVLITSGFAIYSQYNNQKTVKLALAMPPPVSQAAAQAASAQTTGAAS